MALIFLNIILNRIPESIFFVIITQFEKKYVLFPSSFNLILYILSNSNCCIILIASTNQCVYFLFLVLSKISILIYFLIKMQMLNEDILIYSQVRSHSSLGCCKHNKSFLENNKVFPIDGHSLLHHSKSPSINSHYLHLLPEVAAACFRPTQICMVY